MRRSTCVGTLSGSGAKSSPTSLSRTRRSTARARALRASSSWLPPPSCAIDSCIIVATETTEREIGWCESAGSDDSSSMVAMPSPSPDDLARSRCRCCSRSEVVVSTTDRRSEPTRITGPPLRRGASPSAPRSPLTPTPPPPPPPPAKCSTTLSGDTDIVTCKSFCKAANAGRHCSMCKCRGCSFCAHEVERRATAVTAPALAPPSTLTTQLAQKLAKPAPVPCSSTVAGDTDVEACKPFCKPENAKNHCGVCKCKGCAFCSKG
mmetsp:Transcript_26926/g.80536  ORF Transcript_26926/g.80536 Transcript_26926/m.80536 type:complete len:264 (-) Transcript_26926:218-1009(-)